MFQSHANQMYNYVSELHRIIRTVVRASASAVAEQGRSSNVTERSFKTAGSLAAVQQGRVSSTEQRPMRAPEAVAIARIMDSLVSLVQQSGYRHQMGSAQWSALRYFNEVNPASATVVSFANHNRSTPGTASRTVTSLVRKGLLLRVPDPNDRRSHRLVLSEHGQTVLKDDPIVILEKAVEMLPGESRTELVRALRRMAEAVHREDHDGA